MKYKILDIVPGQVKVEYEDKSLAVVPINPDATLEDIDHEVSKYDPDFLKKPEYIQNPDIYIGLERTSVRKEDVEIKPTTSPIKVDLPSTITQPTVSRNISSRPFSLDSIAKYLNRKGDNRLLDVLDSFIEEYLQKFNVSVEDLIIDANGSNPMNTNKNTLTPEELFEKAEAELEEESTNTI